MLTRVLGVFPLVVVLKYSVGTHWHILVSHVELIHWVKLSWPTVETHLSHIVFGDVHLVLLLPLRELLIHCLILS